MAIIQKKAEELELGDWMEYPKDGAFIFSPVAIMETDTEVVVTGSIFNGARVDFDTLRFPLGTLVGVAE